MTNLDSRVKGISWDEKVLLRFSASLITSCTLGLDMSYFLNKSKTSPSQDEALLIVHFDPLHVTLLPQDRHQGFSATL